MRAHGWGIGVVVMALGWVGSIDQARACESDPCRDTNQFASFRPVNTTIATDGVIAFSWERGYVDLAFSVEDVLQYVAVEVEDESRQVIPGSVTYHDWANAIVWAPSEPLTTVGMELTLHLQVNNSAIRQEFDGGYPCSFDIDNAYAIVVGDPLPPSLEVEPSVSEEVDFLGLEDIEHLVCCDGAMPEEDNECGPYVSWSEGRCESTIRRGRLTVQWDLDWRVAPDVAATVAPRFVGEDGTWFGEPADTSLAVRSDEVFCGTFELVSLIDGSTVTSHDGCHGEDVSDMLGVVERDPSPGLFSCDGDPYVCEVVTASGSSRRWDAERCELWGQDDVGDDGHDDGEAGGTGGISGVDDAGLNEGISDRGCSCTHAAAVPGGMTTWLIALVIVRRRATVR